MIRPVPLVIALTGSLWGHAFGADMEGTIVIKRRLTKPAVTLELSTYQRGTAVPLGRDEFANRGEKRGEMPASDPLSEERARVVVWVEGQREADPGRAAIRQIERRFMPDLVVVPAGSTVAFPNMDPIFHNVFSLSKPKSFDLGNYPKGDSRSVVFDRPGIVSVDCHLHPNMAATVVVTPNRWAARAGTDGLFVIRDLPPGEYTVVAWHRAVGQFRKLVRVEEGRPAHVEFSLPLAADGPGVPPEAKAFR